MKKNGLFILFYTFITLICFACQSNEIGGRKDYFTLKMNENCVIPNDNNAITLSFIGVSDERCSKPMCYQCYGSKADILLSITNSENTKTEINLSIIGCIDEYEGPATNYVDTLGYRFNLVKLSPYPDVEPINENDYIAKIKITKL